MRMSSDFRKSLFVLTFFPAFLLLGTCYIANYPIRSLPFLDVLGILVPVLILVNLLFFFFWILIKKRYALIPLISLFCGLLCFGSIYQFHFSDKVTQEKELSILTYNVHDFNSRKGRDFANALRDEILVFIEKKDPDIICFQEMGWIESRQLGKYPYKYQTPYFADRAPQGIFSKFPIVDTGSLEFPNSSNNAIYADIVYERDTIRVYNVHLESFKIRSFRSLLKKDIGFHFLRKMQYISLKHREQVRILQRHREESPYPVVYCGDFNQPPYSPSFKLLLKDMRDSFVEAGNGWGTTFKRSFISARIDFILADDKAFEIIDHQNLDLHKSDHLPIMARLKYLSD